MCCMPCSCKAVKIFFRILCWIHLHNFIIMLCNYPIESKMYTIYWTNCKQSGCKIEANEANESEREPNKFMKLHNKRAHLEVVRWGENAISAPYAKQYKSKVTIATMIVLGWGSKGESCFPCYFTSIKLTIMGTTKTRMAWREDGMVSLCCAMLHLRMLNVTLKGNCAWEKTLLHWWPRNVFALATLSISKSFCYQNYIW